MKLKDCIPQIDDFNLDTWDPKEIIEVLWDNGEPYPANILQFGALYDFSLFPQSNPGLKETRYETVNAKRDAEEERALRILTRSLDPKILMEPYRDLGGE
ncbi:hypothetical protein AVEN_127060-1 [Araneus ventricosus]|uniref:Uncharacterized protein n=1 Tax=Araneus ventricosus TaxID=182803 RepID=A0A4Y2I3B1_ARAVE|nr:hypothetical protein AVEN_127060-1 [Araneus ventricosus]